MDFFNKAKESLKNAGAAVSQKASGVSSTVTLTMKIKEAEKEIKECHLEIAKVMVKDHFEELLGICPDACKRIQELQDQIEKDKKELAIAKGLQICPNCGSEENSDVICCTKCGTNIQEANSYLNNVMQEEKAVVCPKCGQAVENGAFCPNCGTKVL